MGSQIRFSEMEFLRIKKIKVLKSCNSLLINHEYNLNILGFFNVVIVFFLTRVFIYNKLHYSLLLYIWCVNYWYNLLGVQLNLWQGDFILNCFNLRVGQGMHYESHHFAEFGVLTRFTPNSNHSKSFVVGIYCL
jgi:hypothetical protein